MVMIEHPTARYSILADPDGNRYRFFCEVSGMVLCTTGPIRADTQAQALQLAWDTEGKRHFNRCMKCGKWVSDPMYNADMLQCVDCAPWEEARKYCTHCGEKRSPAARFCTVCGADLHREAR